MTTKREEDLRLEAIDTITDRILDVFRKRYPEDLNLDSEEYAEIHILLKEELDDYYPKEA